MNNNITSEKYIHCIATTIQYENQKAHALKIAEPGKEKSTHLAYPSGQ